MPSLDRAVHGLTFMASQVTPHTQCPISQDLENILVSTHTCMTASKHVYAFQSVGHPFHLYVCVHVHSHLLSTLLTWSYSISCEHCEKAVFWYFLDICMHLSKQHGLYMKSISKQHGLYMKSIAHNSWWL